MKEKTKSWIEFASRDLLAAEKLKNEPGISTIVLYHCQQCIEKSIKALYEERDMRVPRIHATLKLFSDLREKFAFIPEFIKNEELVFIDSIYLDTRYPGGLGMLPQGIPSENEVKKGIAIAQDVLRSVEELLK